MNTKALLVGMVLFAGGVAFAQAGGPPRSGTVTVTGTAGNAVSLTTASSNAALAAAVDFDALALDPANVGVAVRPFSFWLRGNVNYSLGASYAAGANTSGVTAADIGLRLASATASGADVVARADTMVAPWNTTWSAATGSSADLNGATLSALSTNPAAPTVIMTGNRISSRGNFSSLTNALAVSAEIGMVPQIFAPGTFSYTVTLTVAATP